MDIIAQELGIDPVELRLRNVIHDGDMTGRGHSYRNVQGRGDAARGGGGRPTSASRSAGPYVGRGLALGDRGIGGGADGRDPAAAPRRPRGRALRRARPGRRHVDDAAPGRGRGAGAADRAGIGRAVRHRRAPFDAGAGASRHTHIAGRAALQAAEELDARLRRGGRRRCSASTADDVRREGGEYLADGRAVPFAARGRAGGERCRRHAGGARRGEPAATPTRPASSPRWPRSRWIPRRARCGCAGW